MIDRFRSLSAQFSARLYNFLGGANDFFAAAADVTELCAAEFIDGHPLKMAKAQLERVTSAAFGMPLCKEMEVAQGAPRKVGPTRVYRFRDVTVAKRWVIAANRHEEFLWPRSEWAFSDPEFIAEAAFADSIQGSRYFGHWLSDDCATSAILPTDMPLVRPQRNEWADEKLYSELLEIRSARSVSHARIRELIYIDDLANNSHKLQRIKEKRTLLRKNLPRSIANDVVYISRGQSARGRVIENEPQLIDALVSYGVKVVEAEKLDSLAFLQQIIDANLVISAEGSQCAHAMYGLRDGASGLITLQPHDRFFLAHLEWARLLGFDFGVVVSDPARGPFWIDPEEVLRTIDLF